MTLVLFSLRMFPLLLFQGVSPVHNSCSLMIAHWRSALILGSSSGLTMGLVLVGGAPPPHPPLRHSLSLHGVIARNYHPLCQTSQCKNEGWCST